MQTKQCEVCNGGGDYPVIDNFGSTRFYIRCPECYGTGQEVDEEAEAEEAEAEKAYPPRSTASTITSMDEMREHVRKHWSS